VFNGDIIFFFSVLLLYRAVKTAVIYTSIPLYLRDFCIFLDLALNLAITHSPFRISSSIHGHVPAIKGFAERPACAPWLGIVYPITPGADKLGTPGYYGTGISQDRLLDP